MDHGDDGHSNGDTETDATQQQVDYAARDGSKWPERPSPEPQADKGIIREDVR